MQRVRFRRLTISLGLALLLSLLLMSGGISAQDANQVAADKTWASGDAAVGEAARTVTVTVNDANIHIPGPQTDVGPDRFDIVFAIPAGAAKNDVITLHVDSFPIADRSGDGVVNHQDVDVVVPGTALAVNVDGDLLVDLEVQGVEFASGQIEVRVIDDNAGGVFPATAFQLNYNADVVNVSTQADGGEPVVITSSQNAAGFGLRLRETTNNSALFSATFIVVNDATAVADLDLTSTHLYDTFDENGVGVDLDASGGAVGTAIVVGLHEAFYGVDLSTPANGTITDVITAGTVGEIAAGVDLDGDGDIGTLLGPGGPNVEKLVTAGRLYEAAYGADLNGDGDALDAVTQYDAGLFLDGKRPVILVSAASNDQITITYNDLDGALARTGTRSTDTVSTEAIDPGFTGLTPVTGAATTSTVPKLQADVIDTDSGVVEASVAFNVFAWADDGDGVVQAGEVGAAIAGSPFDKVDGDDVDNVTTTAISGGFRANVTLPQQATEVDLAWQVVATDLAGNAGTSDSDSATAVDHQALSIDNAPPILNEAFTGHTWDAVAPAIVGDDDGEADSRTSVRVAFDETIDAASVVPSDFRVANGTPSAADVFGSNVFLTVNTLDPSAKPLVELVGTVTDRAGNELNAGPEVTSADGIAPGITVAVDKTLTDDEVRVTITSDEDIVGSPALTANGNVVIGLSNPSARVWETTISTGEADPPPSISAVVDVVATGGDSTGNPGTSAAASYELDLAIDGGVAAPTFIVSGDAAGGLAETSEANPFVRIKFDAEAAEYVGDTHGLITITSLTLTETVAGVAGDAVDILGTEVRRGDNEFVLALSGLTIGSTYTITLNAEDEIGNAYAAVVTNGAGFAVVARPKVTLELQPGMNLVSFPEVPVEPGINDVFPADSNVDVVLAYDPTRDVPWLVSQRNTETGLFGSEGEIQTIQIGWGYWVQSTGFNDIVYSSRPFIQAGVVPPPVPPAIPVVGGQSNLVGFVSLTGAAAVDADTYFEGVTWQVAYSFAPDTGWAAVRPVTPATVDEKKGYILFAARDGWVTP